jgi:hypothetical protein
MEDEFFGIVAGGIVLVAIVCFVIMKTTGIV